MEVLIIQSDPKLAEQLAEHFQTKGDHVRVTHDESQAIAQLNLQPPDVILIDLHLPNQGWANLIKFARTRTPRARLIATNNYPVIQREQAAKELGVNVFLRKPFTAEWIENAFRRLIAQEQLTSAVPQTPRVQMPVRLKITLPYFLLALLFAGAAAYAMSQIVLDSIEQRYLNQLIETGKLSADWMVNQENQRLETLRVIANVEALPEALAASNAERLRELVLPFAVNTAEEHIEILDTHGLSVLSLRRRPSGNIEEYDSARNSTEFANWDLVQKVLAGAADDEGDKFAGVFQTDRGPTFFVLGPIVDANNQVRGVVLVGKTLAVLVREIRQDTLGQTTIYSKEGRLLASTVLAFDSKDDVSSTEAQTILALQDGDSLIIPFRINENPYSEIVGVWEARNGEDLGLIGSALPQNFLVQASNWTRLQIFFLITAGFVLVILVGVYVANRITRPLLRIVRASTEVAQGNLDVKVNPKGDDEVAVLAQSFNGMLSGLREGSLYRDLLGRTVSPQVREELRHTFAAGDLKLEGQDALATVLMADIRNFTGLSEQSNPTIIMSWLNEYFGELVPIINSYGGVVNKFDGDALMAFFGILPRAMSGQESATLACKAALEILEAVERINARREAVGEPLFITGIGINTGVVAAGGLGASDRLHYTIIGDTVNVTQRLESLTRQFGESGAVVSHHTYLALGNNQHEFSFEPRGAYRFRGKQAPMAVYRLWGNSH